MPTTAVPRRPRVLAYPRDVESALLGWVPRGSQGELPLPGSKVGPTIKPWALAVGHRKPESSFSVPTDSIKLLFSMASGREGCKDVSLGGKEDGGPLEASSFGAWKHLGGTRPNGYTQEKLSGWLLGRLGGPPSLSGHRRLPGFSPAVRKSSACTWTRHGAEVSWLQYCL